MTKFWQALSNFSIAKLADKLSNNVQPMDKLTGSAEAIILAFVGPVCTWLITIPNMWLVVSFAEGVFGFPFFLAVLVAVALEGVGVGLSNDWVNCKQWNAQQPEDGHFMDSRRAGWLLGGYFVIDLIMVLILAIRNFGNGKGAEVFLTLLFPIVVIITTLATNGRSTLYRLRRGLDEFEREQKPDTTILDILAAIQKRLDSLPKPHAQKSDYFRWWQSLGQKSFASWQAARAAFEATGWQMNPTSAKNWFVEVKK